MKRNIAVATAMVIMLSGISMGAYAADATVPATPSSDASASAAKAPAKAPMGHKHVTHHRVAHKHAQ